jgi:hypothetical protein
MHLMKESYESPEPTPGDDMLFTSYPRDGVWHSGKALIMRTTALQLTLARLR